MNPPAPPISPSNAASPYVGRFAPSPTGPLHLGSLLVAVASYLDAKANNGRWLLRIEDVDSLRTVSGAEDEILWALEAHGLHWDALAPKQTATERQARYREALVQLAQAGHLFDCRCSRKSLRAIGGPYPGTCRHARTEPSAVTAPPAPAKQGSGRPACDCAIRFDSSSVNDSYYFEDRLLGPQQGLLSERGDFVVRRRDGLIAYQLAVVIDDYDQGISDVLRGADILDSTPWQLALGAALSLPATRYTHLPVLTRHGDKLSKQSGATAVLAQQYSGPETLAQRASANLATVLALLGQTLPEGYRELAPEALLADACRQWQLQAITPLMALEVPLGAE